MIHIHIYRVISPPISLQPLRTVCCVLGAGGLIGVHSPSPYILPHHPTLPTERVAYLHAHGKVALRWVSS